MKRNIRKEAKDILKTIGVKPSLKGYYYWPVAVEYAMKWGKLNYKICRDIYECVAKEYKVTGSQVERCLRTVVEGCQTRIKRYFDYEGGEIKNKDFLVLMVEKLEEGGESDER